MNKEGLLNDIKNQINLYKKLFKNIWNVSQTWLDLYICLKNVLYKKQIQNSIIIQAATALMCKVIQVKYLYPPMFTKCQTHV